VTGQPRDNKPSFMQVLRLPIHPSLRGRELPRPTRSTHRLQNPTDTDLGHHASLQTTTSRRRALITGRTILTPVGPTIPTRVVNRGAGPRTRLVPAVPRPPLVAATAGATLGAPRRVAVPGLIGSRGLFPPIVGGPAPALIWLLRRDSRATHSGHSAKSRPTTWNGGSAIWRHNKFLGTARNTTKTMRMMCIRPSPKQGAHCKTTY